MNSNLKAPWLFVIDTNDYAGNFERELCAYITGHIGDCGVGDDMAELYEKEVGNSVPFDNVLDEPDEHGCSRPVTIYPTPGWFNDGMGGSWKLGGEVKALKAYVKAIKAWKDPAIIATKNIIKVLTSGTAAEKSQLSPGWTIASAKQELKEHEAEIKRAQALKKPARYEAFHSVAISFLEKPTQEEIDLMKARAAKFAMLPSYNKAPRISKITGFRLIKNIIKRTTKAQSV